MRPPGGALLSATAHPSKTRRSARSESEKTCPHRLSGRGATAAARQCAPDLDRARALPAPIPGRAVAPSPTTTIRSVSSRMASGRSERAGRKNGVGGHRATALAMLCRCAAAAATAASASAAPGRRAHMCGPNSHVSYPVAPHSAVAGLCARRAASAAAAPGVLGPSTAQRVPTPPIFVLRSRFPRLLRRRSQCRRHLGRRRPRSRVSPLTPAGRAWRCAHRCFGRAVAMMADIGVAPRSARFPSVHAAWPKRARRVRPSPNACV